MTTTRKLVSTETLGTHYGSDFNDRDHIQKLSQAAISRIVVSYDITHIYSLTVYYADKVGVHRGGRGGSSAEVVLEPGEYITVVEGAYYPSSAFTKIAFKTNTGKTWGPYGQISASSSFEWSGFGPNMGLLYFSGMTDGRFIYQLAASFASFRNNKKVQRVVKYEKQMGSGMDPPQSVALSKFAQNLMSPTVTLLVGSDVMEFHASQNILCRLPFFHVALNGQFKEALAKKIEMPEDEPEFVSALIEFLYTGNYTYTYCSKETSDSDSPANDLEEGTFHVGVYAIAFKYDCQQLVDSSVACFMYVLKQLTSIDVIRLWKTAYEKELILPKWEDDDDLWEFRKGLPKLLKELYSTHREEMDTTSAEYPSLVNDLLRLVVSDGSGAVGSMYIAHSAEL